MGIIVPDPEVMPEWAKKKGMSGTYLELCANPVSATSAYDYDYEYQPVNNAVKKKAG